MLFYLRCVMVVDPCDFFLYFLSLRCCFLVGSRCPTAITVAIVLTMKLQGSQLPLRGDMELRYNISGKVLVKGRELIEQENTVAPVWTQAFFLNFA